MCFKLDSRLTFHVHTCKIFHIGVQKNFWNMEKGGETDAPPKSQLNRYKRDVALPENPFSEPLCTVLELI